MTSILSQNAPLSGGGYVPYFYQAGLFQVYGTPEKRERPALHAVPSTPRRFGYDSAASQSLDRTQTVEQIITDGYFAVRQGDPVTAILSDKKKTTWLGLDDIISQIRRRYEIYEQNLYELELGKCAATNALYAHWAYQGPPNARQFYSRHKRLQELYEQERDERTRLWKDVSRLRQALPESAQAYLSSHRKLRALEDIGGGIP